MDRMADGLPEGLRSATPSLFVRELDTAPAIATCMASLPRQQTLAESVSVSGFGFFTNADVTATFHPASEDTGILFVRSDLPGRPEIPATIAYAVERHRRTALGRDNAHVELTEHILAALAGLEIDNCLVELDGPEPPGGDGSAKHFVDALLAAGIVEQSQPAAIFEIPRRMVVTLGDARIVAEPNDSPLANRLARRRGLQVNTGSRYALNLQYDLDFGADSPINRQSARYEVTPETFANEIGGARTFILESEINSLRALGYGEKVTMSDLLVFGEEGVIDNVLRADNECARHKLLDCVGDFALMGARISGKIWANRSGHAANRELIRQLVASRGARQAA